MTISKGDTFDTNRSFKYINAESKEPDTFKLSDYDHFVLVGFPATFSPACTEQHIPGYVGHLKEFADKGVTVIAVNGDNLFSSRAFSKQLGVSEKQDQIVFVSDIGLSVIKKLGLSTDEFGDVLGEVSSRFAVLVKDGKVVYFGQEKSVGDVDLSSAEKVLSYL